MMTSMKKTTGGFFDQRQSRMSKTLQDNTLMDESLEVNKFESVFLVIEYFHQDIGKVV